MSATLVKSDERHYTVKEIAEMWHLDQKSVRTLFHDEEGVIRMGHTDSTFRKRAYSTIRIPESVKDRVYRRLQVKP